MNTEKMREEFEGWAKKNGYYLGGMDGYSSQQTDNAWNVWQASRESLVVELPSLHPAMNTACDNYRSWMNCFRACKEAIESLGLRVKP